MPAKKFSKKTQSVIIVTICIIPVLVAVSFLMRPNVPLPPAGYGESKHKLTIINNHGATTTRTIDVLVAETPAQRERGLSGMLSLPRDEGMLFLFDQSDTFTFWMPDMHFSIDMVWIDENWRVVDVTQHATPESYPKTIFSPRIPARYVLEINDNKTNEWGITNGTVIELHR